MTTELKIRPAEIPPEKARISFRLPEPTIADFQTYLLAFEKVYGTKPDPDFVANEILTSFFASDREFLLFRKTGSFEPAAPASGGKRGRPSKTENASV